MLLCAPYHECMDLLKHDPFYFLHVYCVMNTSCIQLTAVPPHVQNTVTLAILLVHYTIANESFFWFKVSLLTAQFSSSCFYSTALKGSAISLFS